MYRHPHSTGGQPAAAPAHKIRKASSTPPSAGTRIHLMLIHDGLLNDAAEGPGSIQGGCPSLGRRASLALLALGLVAVGVHVGLMIDIARSEGEQARAALAPADSGDGAMAYCVVQGVDYLGSPTDYAPVQATLQSGVTKALGKGCTLAGWMAGAFSPLALGKGCTLAGAFSPLAQPAGSNGVGGGQGARGSSGVQPLLCPAAMVGTTPASWSTVGNVGECMV